MIELCFKKFFILHFCFNSMSDLTNEIKKIISWNIRKYHYVRHENKNTFVTPSKPFLMEKDHYQKKLCFLYTFLTRNIFLKFPRLSVIELLNRWWRKKLKYKKFSLSFYVIITSYISFYNIISVNISLI